MDVLLREVEMKEDLIEFRSILHGVVEILRSTVFRSE